MNQASNRCSQAKTLVHFSTWTPSRNNPPVNQCRTNRVSDSPRCTERAVACRVFGAEVVTTGHLPVLLSQTPHIGSSGGHLIAEGSVNDTVLPA
jgi:hypothetical protein